MRYFDAHGHLSFPAYDADRAEVVFRAKEAGVAGMVTVGTRLDTSQQAVARAKEFPGYVWATIGIHPTHANESTHVDVNELGASGVARAQIFNIDAFKKLAEEPEVVAVGECGLDYYRLDPSDTQSRDAQKKLFLRQLEFAREINKPLMIHCRSAARDFLEIISVHRELLPTTPGIMHFYTDSIDIAKKLLDFGFYFTFGGVITFSRQYDELVRLVPSDRILAETDCPYVAPTPHRGKRNEPAYVKLVCAQVARIKRISLEETAQATSANARRLFRRLR